MAGTNSSGTTTTGDTCNVWLSGWWGGGRCPCVTATAGSHRSWCGGQRSRRPLDPGVGRSVVVVVLLALRCVPSVTSSTAVESCLGFQDRQAEVRLKRIFRERHPTSTGKGRHCIGALRVHGAVVGGFASSAVGVLSPVLGRTGLPVPIPMKIPSGRSLMKTKQWISLPPHYLERTPFAHCKRRPLLTLLCLMPITAVSELCSCEQSWHRCGICRAISVLQTTSRMTRQQSQWNVLLDLCFHCAVDHVFSESLQPVEALQLSKHLHVRQRLALRTARPPGSARVRVM